MRQRLTTLVGFLAAGALFGFAMSSILGPDDVATFWLGNLSSPWAVLAFAAGWSGRRPRWAIGTAVSAEIACVGGFYLHLLHLDPARLGLAPDTAPIAAVAIGLGRWLWFAAPWIGAGIGAGVIYGLLGAWWARSRSLLAGASVALPFLIEPLVWPIYVGHAQGPASIWALEIVAGLAILVIAVFASRRAQARRRPVCSSSTA
jgi:hypothetical protein